MRRMFAIFLTGGLALAGLTGLASVASADQTPPPPLPSEQLNRGIELQSRGPIHQAFAQPREAATEPGVEVPKRPPDPIPEMPPSQKPAGKNVQWIPGYWHWDTDKNDFFWISGVYRDVPPGRRWVAGSWTGTPDSKFRFVDGYWAPAEQNRREYVPPPPASLENGPSAPPPDDNAIYTPGSWMYQDQRYLWQPGYYAAPQPGRVWIGPRYVWTPAGCIFVSGYWDYPLEARGCLYPPVYFTQPLWLTPGWCYQPVAALDFAPLFSSFFLGPGYHHYFYGNYFGPRFAALGYRPWYGYGRGWGDPLFNYYGWRYRGNPGWFAGLGRGHAGYSAYGGRGFVTSQNHFHSAARALPAINPSFSGPHAFAGHGARYSGAAFHSGSSAGHVAHGGAQHFGAGHNVQHFATASVHHAAPAHYGSFSHGGGGHGSGSGHGGGGHGSGHGGGHGGDGHGGGHGGGGHGGGGHGGGHQR